MSQPINNQNNVTVLPYMKSNGSMGQVEVSKDGLVTVDGRCTDGSREKLYDAIRFARVTDAALQIAPALAATYFANSLGIEAKFSEMDALIEETPVGLLFEPFVTGASFFLNAITHNLFSQTPVAMIDACLADPAGRQASVK
jgi:hypothetical protein